MCAALLVSNQRISRMGRRARRGKPTEFNFNLSLYPAGSKICKDGCEYTIPSIADEDCFLVTDGKFPGMHGARRRLALPATPVRLDRTTPSLSPILTSNLRRASRDKSVCLMEVAPTRATRPVGQHKVGSSCQPDGACPTGKVKGPDGSCVDEPLCCWQGERQRWQL